MCRLSVGLDGHPEQVKTVGDPSTLQVLLIPEELMIPRRPIGPARQGLGPDEPLAEGVDAQSDLGVGVQEQGMVRVQGGGAHAVGSPAHRELQGRPGSRRGIREGDGAGGRQGRRLRDRLVPPDQIPAEVARHLRSILEACIGRKAPIVRLGHVAPVALVEAALHLDRLARLKDHVPREGVEDVVGLAAQGGGRDRHLDIAGHAGASGHEARPVHPGLFGLVGAVAVEPVAHRHVIEAQGPGPRVHDLDLGMGAVRGVGSHTAQKLDLKARAGHDGCGSESGRGWNRRGAKG